MSSTYTAPAPAPFPPFRISMVTTAFTLDGYNIVRNLGLVRGIIVRSRSIVGTIGATLQTHRRRQHHVAHQSVRANS